MNVGGAQAFVVAVIPFHQVGIDGDAVAESCELTRAAGALERTGEDGGEGERLEANSEATCILFAPGREREIGPAGVLAREGPVGFAVAGEIDRVGDVKSQRSKVPGV